MSLMRAIQWRWPGASVVIRENAPVEWHGPMAKPSEAEIAQAVTDYAANTAAILAAEHDACAALIDDNALIQAVAMLDFEERQKLQVKAGQTLRTPAECKARIRAIYRALLD